MTKTPRTDTLSAKLWNDSEPGSLTTRGLVVADELSNHARQLELENTAMKEAIKLSSSAFARTLHLLEHVPATREMETLSSGAEEDIRAAILKLEPFLK
jgi:hypothetical protein